MFLFDMDKTDYQIRYAVCFNLVYSDQLFVDKRMTVEDRLDQCNYSD